MWLVAALSLSSASAQDQITVLGGLSVDLELSAGASRTGALELRNNTDVDVTVLLYERDYAFEANGSNRYDPPGTLARSNTAWVTWSAEQVTLPAGATVPVGYTVDVPADPSLAGTYWSVLMLEPMGERFTARADGDDRAIGVTPVYRSAVQLVTTLPDERVGLGLLGGSLANDGGPVSLAVDVGNNGGRLSAPKVWVDLYDAAGAKVGRYEGGTRRLFPGCSARFRVPLDAVAPGDYTAVVVADGGADALVGARVPVSL